MIIQQDSSVWGQRIYERYNHSPTMAEEFFVRNLAAALECRRRNNGGT